MSDEAKVSRLLKIIKERQEDLSNTDITIVMRQGVIKAIQAKETIVKYK